MTTPGKTKRSIRIIPIPLNIKNILLELKKEEDFYILSNSEKPIEPRTYRKYYMSIIEKIGIKPLKFHALRHTFASINVENGVDIKTVSELLGHSEESITLKTYTHISNKAKRNAIEKMADIICL